MNNIVLFLYPHPCFRRVSASAPGRSRQIIDLRVQWQRGRIRTESLTLAGALLVRKNDEKCNDNKIISEPFALHRHRSGVFSSTTVVLIWKIDFSRNRSAPHWHPLYTRVLLTYIQFILDCDKTAVLCKCYKCHNIFSVVFVSFHRFCRFTFNPRRILLAVYLYNTTIPQRFSCRVYI